MLTYIYSPTVTYVAFESLACYYVDLALFLIRQILKSGDSKRGGSFSPPLSPDANNTPVIRNRRITLQQGIAHVTNIHYSIYQHANGSGRQTTRGRGLTISRSMTATAASILNRDRCRNTLIPTAALNPAMGSRKLEAQQQQPRRNEKTNKSVLRGSGRIPRQRREETRGPEASISKQECLATRWGAPCIH